MVGIWHLACQTYALNLIDSQGGQSRAPQLFSSSKSFRIAKSTPSSAKSSAKLPPISKWLLKPPLLSKPPLLFKSPLLSKSALVLAPLLLLSYTQGIQALTAQTSREIEGSAPYLTFDGGRTKLTNTDRLLSIKLQNGTVYTRSTNPSTPTNPIRLPRSGVSFDSIEMIVPPSRSSITINDLVSQGYWGDDDGDGRGVGGVTASGSISVTFKDKNGNTVNRTNALNICKAPYKVTLTSTGGTLSTQYGVPRSSSFSGATVDYYINPNDDIRICSVRPNLNHGSGVYAGSSYLWGPREGFLHPTSNPSYYYENFPTTGADGLYFDLDVGGLDVAQLTWSPVTHGGITATVTSVTPSDSWIFASERTKVARVKLSGPRASSSQIQSANPSLLTSPPLPQTFELVGRGSSGNLVIKYGFMLKQWFVNRGDKQASESDQISWCSRLRGYRLPKVKELVKFGCTSVSGMPCSSSDDHYSRGVDRGFLGEWGRLGDYTDVGFVTHGFYWADNPASIGSFVVRVDNGPLATTAGTNTHYAVCTTP